MEEIGKKMLKLLKTRFLFFSKEYLVTNSKLLRTYFRQLSSAPVDRELHEPGDATIERPRHGRQLAPTGRSITPQQQQQQQKTHHRQQHLHQQQVDLLVVAIILIQDNEIKLSQIFRLFCYRKMLMLLFLNN